MTIGSVDSALAARFGAAGTPEGAVQAGEGASFVQTDATDGRPEFIKAKGSGFGTTGYVRKWQHIPARMFRVGPSSSAATNSAGLAAALLAAANEGVDVTLDRTPAASPINVNAEFTIPAGVGIAGDGGRARIQQQQTGAGLLIVGGSDVSVRRVKLIGPSGTSSDTPANAIKAFGALATYLDGLELKDVWLDSWGQHCVYARYLQNFKFRRVRATNYWYAGIGLESCSYGDVGEFWADTAYAPTNAYGFYASREALATLALAPRCYDIRVSGRVLNIPQWEAWDTHAGKKIRFLGVSSYNCKFGVAIVPATNNLGVSTFAPQDCEVDGADLDSGVTDGSASYGVSVAGATGAVGAPTEYAINCAVRNVKLRGHGDEGIGTSGAIYCHDTLGLQIANVQGIECSPAVINLANDNKQFDITTVKSIDHWTKTAALCVAVFLSNDYNTGLIDDVTVARGTKVIGAGTGQATLVNDKGVRIANQANNSVQLGINELSACTTPLDDGGAHGSTRIRTKATFDQLVTLTGGMTSAADIDATGGWRNADDGFYLNAISANGTTTLNRNTARTAYQTKLICGTAGSVTCIWARLDGTLAGTTQIVVRLKKNGTVVGFNVTLLAATGTNLQRNIDVKDAWPFAVGDVLEFEAVVTSFSGGPYNLVAGLVREVS